MFNVILLFVSTEIILDSESKQSPQNNEMMAKHLKNINIAIRNKDVFKQIYYNKRIPKAIIIIRHRCYAYE